MILPQANKSGVKSLGRYDTTAPFREASAKIEGYRGVSRGVNQVARAAGNLIQQAQADRDAQELADFENTVIETSNDLDIDISERGAYWDVQDLPDSMQEEIQEIKVNDGFGNVTSEQPEKIVSSKVIAKYRYEQQKANIEAAASRISNEKIRIKAVAGQMEILKKQYAQDQLYEIKLQQQENAVKQQTAIDNSLSLEQAIANVKASSMTPAQQDAVIFEQRQKWEYNDYEKIIMEGVNKREPSVMIETADYVGSKEYTGSLSAKQRNDVVAKLLSKANQVNNGNKLETLAVQSKTREETVSILNLFKDGEDTEESYLKAKEIIADPVKYRSLTPEQGQALFTYVKYSPRLRVYSLLTNSSEKRRIFDEEKDPVLKLLYSQQAKADTRKATENPYARQAKVTGTPEAQFPNKLQKPSQPGEYKQKLQDFIVDSHSQWLTAREAFGKNVPPISKTNVPEIKSYLETASPKDQLEFYAMVAGTYTTDEAGKFFQQLKVSRPNGLYLAGQLYADGDLINAEKIIKGIKRLKSGVISDEMTIQWNNEIVSQIGAVYVDLPEDRKAITQAAVALLATKTPEEIKGSWYETEGGQRQDLVEEILNDIAPIIDMGDYKIAVPRGTGKYAFKEWVALSKDSKAEYLYDNYDIAVNPQALAPNENESQYVVKELEAGNLRYKSAGYGKYYIVTDLEQPLLDSNTGEPVIFVTPLQRINNGVNQ